MLIAVAGATGTVGHHIADLLTAQGHEVRRLSRHSDRFPVDVATGAGVAEALRSVEVVINAVNGPPTRRAEPVLVDGVRQLLAAARTAHHVLVSIVGTDRVPGTYYTLKLAQERVLTASGVPYTIVRSTQFHEFLGGPLRKLAAAGIELRSTARFQPIAAAEVAAAVARIATEPAHNTIVSVAGPQVLTLTELRPRCGLPVPLPLPSRLDAPLKQGAMTDPNPDIRGVQTYHQWLSEHRGTAWLGTSTPAHGLANRFSRLSRRRLG